MIPGPPGPLDPSGPRGRFPLRLALFGVVAVVSVFFGFLAHNVDESRDLVQRYGYWTMAFTFGWALIAWGRLAPELWRHRPALSGREAAATGATILALTAVAVLTVPYTHKVLYDEMVLQNTALSLHQAREVGTVVRAFEVEGAFRIVGTYLDKRPFFFAFVVSLLHDLTGYRPANAFALNTALMPVILGLLYLLARRLVTHRAALAAVVAFGAFSLLAHNATGAGMEMLNLAMLLLCLGLAIHYLERPDEVRLAALVLAAVLLAQTRYESGLYVAPVALVVLEGWRRAGRIVLPAAAVLAPALLIPYALHNTYLSGTPSLWELREGTETRFAAQFLGENLIRAGRFFFNFTANIPSSWWLGCAGLPAFAWAAWTLGRGMRRWREAPAPAAACAIFGASITANLGLLMFYYWGQLDDPIVARLSLPFCALLALALAWAAERVPARWRSSAVALVAAGALGSYLTHGLRVNSTHWERNLLMRETEWEAEALARQPPARRLVISNKSPLFWLLNEVPSLHVSRARWQAERIKFHLDHHTFDEVIVLQTLRPTTADGDFQLEPNDRLPDSFVLEPLAERQWGSHLARISRVRQIRLDAAPAAPVNPPAP